MCEHSVFLSYLLVGVTLLIQEWEKASFQKQSMDLHIQRGAQRVTEDIVHYVCICNLGKLSEGWDLLVLLYSERLFLEDRNTPLAA